MAITDKCKKLFEGAESRISEIVENTSDDFRSAANAAGKLIVKNLLFNFVTSLVLVAVAIGGYIYVQNYRDGTRIAEAKAVEALAEERAKFADEMEIERTKLENEIALKKRLIEQNAIASYKNSESYREDACRFVASNICNIYCLQYMYIYIKSNDIKKYPELKSFYNDFIKRGYKEYKKNYSD
ncbi:hypothetical protein [uncultured Treponema sp.]|uniref:hypothetical protein n=1 Tax=uncultured Treponema sp. TaxID=162155 RepID=UPI0026252AD7|nr:hypothetical protein [uncultured Treponema sp.]